MTQPQALHVWQTVFWASIIAWWAMEMWIFSRDRRQVKGRSADSGSLWVIGVLIALALWGAAAARRQFPQAAMAEPQPAGLMIAILVMWLGVALRLWSVLTLGAFFRVTVVVQDEHRLITRGPYSRLRHPSYAGGLLTMTGFGVGMDNWVSLGLMILLPLAAYGWRVRAEETALRGRFGEDYAAYAKRTWAMLPFIW